MRFGYFIALWTQLYSHWLILFGSFREAFCFLAYVTALRLPRFISNAFENDFAAIHHRVNLTNSLTKSCQCTRRLKTGFLLFFICLFQSKSRLLHRTRTTKPHKKSEGGLAARGRPSPRGSAWAWPGEKRLGPARRWGPGPAVRARARPGRNRLSPAGWARPLAGCVPPPAGHDGTGMARPGKQLPIGPGLGYSRKSRAPSSRPPPPPLFFSRGRHIKRRWNK